MAEKIRVELDNATDIGFQEIVDDAIKTQKSLDEVAEKAHEASLGFDAVSESTQHVSEASRQAAADYAKLSSETDGVSSSHSKLKGILDKVTGGISDMAHEWGVSRDTTSSVINGMVGMFGKLAPPIVAVTAVIGTLRQVWAETGKEIGEDGKITSNLDRIDAAAGRVLEQFSRIGAAEKKAGDEGKGFGAMASEAAKIATSGFNYVTASIRGTTDATVKASDEVDRFMEKTDAAIKLKEKLAKGDFGSATKTEAEIASDNFKEWDKWDTKRRADRAARDEKEAIESAAREDAALQDKKDANKEIEDAIADYKKQAEFDVEDEILRNLKQSLEMQGGQHELLHNLRLKQIALETKRAVEGAKTELDSVKALAEGARKQSAAEADYNRSNLQRQADDRKKKAADEIETERKKNEALRALVDKDKDKPNILAGVDPRKAQQEVINARREKARSDFAKEHADEFQGADEAGRRKLIEQARQAGNRGAASANRDIRSGNVDQKEINDAQARVARSNIDTAQEAGKLGKTAADNARANVENAQAVQNALADQAKQIEEMNRQMQATTQAVSGNNQKFRNQQGARRG